ncbi:hypothetical protein QFC24_005370 [Naganishia onofrii]|uniref:Uncharacterized protein n=1 Tax=Naganishia onofrii TaxID=1851511 RepID=A0ACC2X8Q1_9TREE|nr:hypothetical protein QFC24_005370 [Naganishia onofrii]
MAMQQIEVSADDQAALNAIRVDNEKSRPKATTNSYKGPQKEYRDWCLKRAVERDGKPPLDQIDEGKKGLREGSPADDVTGGKEVGWKTMERYLCALCDLQKAQGSTTQTVMVSPRAHPEVQALGQTLKRKNADLKKSHFNDRAQGAT